MEGEEDPWSINLLTVIAFIVGIATIVDLMR
jgi:hypothetical protein